LCDTLYFIHFFSEAQPAKKRVREESEGKDSEPLLIEKKTTRNKRGRKLSEADIPSSTFVTIAAPIEDNPEQRKKWKVKPQNDEGVIVPNPKQRTLSSGIIIADHVIGNGLEPRLGSRVSITYEGLFPNGHVFDTHLKRTKPFQFRVGAGQV
jgi:FKBP-type peptidyl-prolyl cis-trans isomerase